MAVDRFVNTRGGGALLPRRGFTPAPRPNTGSDCYRSTLLKKKVPHTLHAEPFFVMFTALRAATTPVRAGVNEGVSIAIN
jgi:hypothetical protein